MQKAMDQMKTQSLLQRTKTMARKPAADDDGSDAGGSKLSTPSGPTVNSAELAAKAA